jgi:ABC-type branched-subunit amino acid transport system permease subunit/ABC-type branched-subunit amino acid transport system ATPase component
MELALHIAVMVCLYAILATSINLLIGFAGLFAFGHAVFYALGAYATALAAMRMHLPFPLPLLVSVVITGLVGLAVALPSLRISGIYLVITTLALQVIAIDVIINWTSLTGGPTGLSGVPAITLFGRHLSGPARVLPVAAVAALLCFLVARHLGESPFGRALRAMRENESAAVSVGKYIFYMKVSVFGMSAALASVAGSLFAYYLSYVGADSFQVSETVLILSMVVVGGTGNLLGSVLGAAILVLLPEALAFIDLPEGIAGQLRLLIYGCTLVLFFVFRPEGLLREPRRAGRRTLLDADPVAAPMATDAPAANQVVLEGIGLQKRFGGITAISELDITLRSGQITGLVGPNGAGKTTLLRTLFGLIKARSGGVSFAGRDITGRSPSANITDGLAMVPQGHGTFRTLGVRQNLELGGFSITDRQVLAERLARVFALFPMLQERQQQIGGTLSGGQQQMLAIGMALMSAPRLLILDEPSIGLAPLLVERVMASIREINRTYGTTILLVEQNLKHGLAMRRALWW